MSVAEKTGETPWEYDKTTGFRTGIRYRRPKPNERCLLCSKPAEVETEQPVLFKDTMVRRYCRACWERPQTCVACRQPTPRSSWPFDESTPAP